MAPEQQISAFAIPVVQRSMTLCLAHCRFAILGQEPDEPISSRASKPLIDSSTDARDILAASLPSTAR